MEQLGSKLSPHLLDHVYHTPFGQGLKLVVNLYLFITYTMKVSCIQFI